MRSDLVRHGLVEMKAGDRRVDELGNVAGQRRIGVDAEGLRGGGGDDAREHGNAQHVHLPSAAEAGDAASCCSQSSTKRVHAQVCHLVWGKRQRGYLADAGPRDTSSGRVDKAPLLSVGVFC
eukprot:scaffold13094_cov70-Phaeocystis_antarctica.AAC.1